MYSLSPQSLGTSENSMQICIKNSYQILYSTALSFHLSKNQLYTNALSRALCISTNSWPDLLPQDMLCQCPFSGFMHFYRKRTASQIRQQSLVSMPFLGLYPFLHYFSSYFCYPYIYVSMPFLGLYPFLP